MIFLYLALVKTEVCNRFAVGIVGLSGFLFGACAWPKAAVQGETLEERRAFVMKDARSILNRLKTGKPDVAEELDEAEGLAVFRYRSSKMPLLLGGFGGGGGYGVMLENERHEQPTYLSLDKTVWGGGMGTREMGAVMVFDDEEEVDLFVQGGKFSEQGFEVTLKGSPQGAGGGIGLAAKQFKGFKVYAITESGISNGVTWRTYKYEPDPELNGRAPPVDPATPPS